jgi:hypothetical protein
MSSNTIDIVGTLCDACGKGEAKVVWFLKESRSIRYFYGCSNSTQEQPCKGSKAWQRIQVPDHLKEPEHMTKKDKNLQKKRNSVTKIKVDDKDEKLKVTITKKMKKKKLKDEDSYHESNEEH